jgi:hypothetical protein
MPEEGGLGLFPVLLDKAGFGSGPGADHRQVAHTMQGTQAVAGIRREAEVGRPWAPDKYCPKMLGSPTSASCALACRCLLPGLGLLLTPPCVQLSHRAVPMHGNCWPLWSPDFSFHESLWPRHTPKGFHQAASKAGTEGDSSLLVPWGAHVASCTSALRECAHVSRCVHRLVSACINVSACVTVCWLPHTGEEGTICTSWEDPVGGWHMHIQEGKPSCSAPGTRPGLLNFLSFFGPPHLSRAPVLPSPCQPPAHLCPGREMGLKLSPEDLCLSPASTPAFHEPLSLHLLTHHSAFPNG